MTWEFRVGQKVACVDDDPGPPYSDGTYHVVPLKAGETYTIRDLQVVEFDETIYDKPDLGVWVDGVFRPEPDGLSGDAPFGSYRFRPLVTDTQKWLREVLETPPPVTTKRHEVERLP